MPILSKELTAALIAGLLSGSLYLVVFGIGFLFMFLPTLPLFTLGLSRRPNLALAGMLVATAALIPFAGLPAALVYTLLLGLPSWYICRKSLLCKGDTPDDWFPLGIVFTRLTLWACGAVALMALFYAGDEGGLPHIVAQDIHEALSNYESIYGEAIADLATNWSFLVFSLTIWLWGLALYGHGWLANRSLAKHKKQLRPDFALRVFAMPGWIIPLLAICALASLIGGPSLAFLGKSTMISLMLPYFFLGAALMHAASKSWSSRRFFLFFIYFMIFAQFWPALILSGLGLWHQLKNLNKHLSSGGTSSSN